MNLHRISRKFLNLNPLVIFYYFAVTSIVVRGVIFWAVSDGHIPAVYFHGRHIHHFVWGFLFLASAVYLAYRKHTPRWVLEILVGIGLGLIFDEFIFWARWRFDYWSMQNFYALAGLGIAAGLLSLFHPRAFEIKIKPHPQQRKKYSFKRQVMLPWISFAFILLMLFIYGKPSKLSAQQTKPAEQIEHIQQTNQ